MCFDLEGKKMGRVWRSSRGEGEHCEGQEGEGAHR